MSKKKKKTIDWKKCVVRIHPKIYKRLVSLSNHGEHSFNTIINIALRKYLPREQEVLIEKMEKEIYYQSVFDGLDD